MFIDSLTGFYERNEEILHPPCHRLLKIAWILELDNTGTFRGFTDVSDKDIAVIAPASMRSGGKVLAHFVVDNASYVLGYHGTVSTAKKRCRNYRSNLEAATQRIESEPLHAFGRFLNSAHEMRKALVTARERGVSPKDNLLPAVDDTFLACKVDQPPTELHRALHREWHRMFRKEYEGRQARCLRCGKEKPVLDRHEKVRLCLRIIGSGTRPRRPT